VLQSQSYYRQASNVDLENNLLCILQIFTPKKIDSNKLYNCESEIYFFVIFQIVLRSSSFYKTDTFDFNLTLSRGYAVHIYIYKEYVLVQRPSGI
jgi:hypothetical protein